MEIQLKQRLIGAIVIFTLLIIFLPMFFDQDNDSQHVEQLLTSLSNNSVQDNQVIDSKEISDFIADNSMLLSQNSADVSLKSKANTAHDGQDAEDIHVNKPVIKSQATESQPEVAEIHKTNDNFIKQSDVAAAKINKSLTIAEKLKAAEELSQVLGKKPVSEKPLEQLNAGSGKTIKYDISSSLGASDVYAVRVSDAKGSSDAEKIKNRLLAMGFPAYTHTASDKVEVLVGPDLELKYVKELANRILDETDYQPEIISHNKNWVSSD